MTNQMNPAALSEAKKESQCRAGRVEKSKSRDLGFR